MGVVVVVVLAVVVSLLLRGQDDSGESGDASSATEDFLDAVHGDQALASSSGLLSSDGVLIAAGSKFCEARGSGGPFNQGRLFVLDYLRPQVSDEEFSTLVLVSDAAADHLCPVEGLDD